MNYYKKGDWNAVCDVCGWKFKASQLMKRWDGAVVCKRDFEHRHPQDLIRVPHEDTSVPWSRPEPADIMIEVDYVATTVGTQSNQFPAGTFGIPQDYVNAPYVDEGYVEEEGIVS